jgi:hypothetical protein
MIAPALPRWVAGLLADPTTGVNALAPLVPKGHAESAPPLLAVFNTVDDAWVARKYVDVDEATPDEWVLLVRVAEEMQIAGTPGDGSIEDSATVVVELHGVAIDSDNADALAIAFRVMRAVRRCLYLAFREQAMRPLLLEGQSIDLPSRLQGFTLDGKPGSGAVSLALVLPFTITDIWAQSA